MRILPLFLLTVLLCSLVHAASREPFEGLVTGDRVRLRAGPGLSYEVLHTVRKRERVQVTAEQGSWYGVRLPPGAPLYVHRSFLQQEGEWARVQGNRVQIRAGAGEGFTSVGSLSAPQSVRVRGILGEWVQIDPPLDSVLGWISKAYVVPLKVPSQSSQEGS